MALTCTACGAELPSAFPGARVVCGCGHAFEVPGGAGAPRSGRGAEKALAADVAGGPYRSAAPSNEPVATREVPVLWERVPAHGADLSALRRPARERALPAVLLAAGAGHLRVHALRLRPRARADARRDRRAMSSLPSSARGGAGRPRTRARVPALRRHVRGARRARGDPVRRRGGRRSSRGTATARAYELGGWSVGTEGAKPLDAVRYVPCPQCHSDDEPRSTSARSRA